MFIHRPPPCEAEKALRALDLPSGTQEAYTGMCPSIIQDKIPELNQLCNEERLQFLRIGRWHVDEYPCEVWRPFTSIITCRMNKGPWSVLFLLPPIRYRIALRWSVFCANSKPLWILWRLVRLALEGVLLAGLPRQRFYHYDIVSLRNNDSNIIGHNKYFAKRKRNILKRLPNHARYVHAGVKKIMLKILDATLWMKCLLGHAMNHEIIWADPYLHCSIEYACQPCAYISA